MANFVPGPASSSPEAEPAKERSSKRAEPPRGRNATSIRKIPWRGWIDILWRIYKQLQSDNIGLVAAGTTFFVILSLVPALAALVSLYGLLNDPASLAAQLDRFSPYVPDMAMDIIRSELSRLISRTDNSLGLSFLISLGLALWSANRGVSAMFQAMNVAYNEEETRGFFKVKGLTLLFTLSMLVFGLVLLNSAITVPLVFQLIGLDGLYTLLAGLMLPLFLLVGSIFGIGALYRWGPSRRSAKWRWISPGAVGAALAMIAVSAGFAYYLSHFGNYGATYGSLGAVIGLMMWVYLSTYVVLLGAEVNAEIEHQTARDSTIGPDRPRGEREAMVADTLGDPHSLGVKKMLRRAKSTWATMKP